MIGGPGGPGGTGGIVAIDVGTTSSTATVYHPRAGHVWAIDPGQAEVVRAGIARLLTRDWPASATSLRDCFVAQALRALPAPGPGGQRGDTPLRVLVGRLEAEAPGDPADGPPRDASERDHAPVLDAVWVTLARFVGQHQPALRAVLLRFHDIARAAFSTPAFTSTGLFPVTLGLPGAGRTEIPNAPGVLAGHGDSDALLARAYRDLWRRITGDARKGRPGPAGEAPGTAVIVYPTTTPPSARDRLRTLVEQQAGIGPASMPYDGGTAAALFTVMRAFGGNAEHGIETFLARSRPAGARSWRQNLLVIDIGGGTTDVAFTALELYDETPPDPGGAPAGPGTPGRRYRLRPRLLGATGHHQLGGNLLTLRVFYWLKAVLADAVRAGAAEPEGSADGPAGWPAGHDGSALGSLAAAVAGNRSLRPAPAAVTEFLRSYLPTRGAPPGGGGARATDDGPVPDAFETLWQMAESAKRTLAGRRPWTPSPGDLGRFAASLGSAPSARQVAGLGQITLAPGDFARLARPVLRRSIDLAVDLMWHRLQAEEGELLDGVALTGRAAGAPLVREILLERLAEAFGRHDPRGRLTPWNPAVISVEDDHPKAAASIGACWAEVQHQFSLPGGEGLPGATHSAGRDRLRIDVDSLVPNLPCRFGLVADGRPVPLLTPGRPLDRSDARGRRFVRSDWRPVIPDIRLVRFLDQRDHVEWGRYRYEGRRGAAPRAGLRFQIELDEDLTPALYVCRGRVPTFVLGGSRIKLRHLLPAGCVDAGGRLRALPQGLLVRVRDALTGQVSWRPMFEAMREIPEGFFTEHFVDDGRLVRAAIATEALPEEEEEEEEEEAAAEEEEEEEEEAAAAEEAEEAGKPGSGTARRDHVLCVGWPAGRAPGAEEALIRVPAPMADVGARRPAAGWLVLDERGVLHVMPGYPRYRPALSLEQMEEHPGSVFATPMDPPVPDWNAEYDPFSGAH